MSPEERQAFWEMLYSTPGFAIWLGNFRDMLIDREANALFSAFVADKIRQRVKDPRVAELLIPQDHGFGTRRVPQESGYYEVYNQPNVELISILDTPIERITPTGLRTTEREFAFDLIVFATGFDAITGSLDRIDIRGVGGQRLKERWRGGLETFMGVMVDGFPNLFMVMGPHTALGNIPRSIASTTSNGSAMSSPTSAATVSAWPMPVATPWTSGPPSSKRRARACSPTRSIPG